ncbi:hypothetical protein VNI00_017313 [Paramarasmius palmivorus]|uniref:Uncharacterized protein n=1 Tax=Paramarasmius palmivorus TaxID=297713 RepID=A0AAW0B8D3_9AGAR
MSNTHHNTDNDSDSDTPYGWNITKLCEAAHHLRIAPQYATYTCEPPVFHEIGLPLPLYEPEHEWYILLTTTPQKHLNPGIYRDARAIQAQFSKGNPPGDECILRYADTLEDARGIWTKQCIKHHREDPAHLQGQEALDDHAYSVASRAKAALVHQELLSAYPHFRPRRRRRPDQNPVVDNSSVSASVANTSSASTTLSVVGNNIPNLEGWHIYVVHAHGQRRHIGLEYALAALHTHGSAPVRMVLAQTSQRARSVFETETGKRDSVTGTS